MLIVLRSTYDDALRLLELERADSRGLIDGFAVQRKDYACKIASLEGEVARLKVDLDKELTRSESWRKECIEKGAKLSALKSTHDSALAEWGEVVAERDAALGRERLAIERANNVATVLTDTEQKLGKVQGSLDMSRSRREVVCKQLDELRLAANKAAIAAREAADFLSLNSSEGSEARMHAECVYDDLADLDAALNN